MKKKILHTYVPGSTYISPFFVAHAAGVNSNPSGGERFFLRTANPRQDPNSCIYYEPAAAAAAAAVEKQKEQKMPKERATIYVYSSTPFFGLIFEDEKTVPIPISSELGHRNYPRHAQQSYSYQVPQLRHLPQTLPVPPSVERA